MPRKKRNRPRKPPRRLREEIVLLFCLLLILFCGSILVGPTLLTNPQKEIENVYIYQRMVNTSNISELLAQKNINLGESAKIKALLRDSLPAGNYLKSFDITLNKLTITYDLTEASGSTMNFGRQTTPSKLLCITPRLCLCWCATWKWWKLT